MKNRTKEKIRKAAEKLIPEKGFKDTTIQNIADSAGVAVGTIYRHYRTKDEILADIGREDLKHASKAQQQRRLEIMDAALDVFGEKGFTRANMEDISEKLGKSKAFIYQYFKNKEELFVSTIRESIYMQSFRHMMDTKGPVQSLEKELEDISGLFIRVFKDKRYLKLVRIVISESPKYPEIGEQLFRGIIERNSGIMGLRLKPVVSEELDPVLFIRLFVSSLWAFVLLHEMVAAKERKTDPETMARLAVRIFSRGGASGRLENADKEEQSP